MFPDPLTGQGQREDTPAPTAQAVAEYLKKAQEERVEAPVGPFNERLAEFQKEMLRMRLEAQKEIARIQAGTQVENARLGAVMRAHLDRQHQQRMEMVTHLERTRAREKLGNDVLNHVLRSLFG